MNVSLYETPKPDFGLGPEWQVILSSSDGINQSIGLKYCSPDGKIYGTFSYIDEFPAMYLHPAQFVIWMKVLVYKMKASILDGLSSYKLQEGVTPPPWQVILSSSPISLSISLPKNDISKYDYLLEETK